MGIAYLLRASSVYYPAISIMVIRDVVNKVLKFSLGFITDNYSGDGSLSRLLALAFATTAIILAFTCPKTMVVASIISTFVVGGVVGLLSRNMGHPTVSVEEGPK